MIGWVADVAMAFGMLCGLGAILGGVWLAARGPGRGKRVQWVVYASAVLFISILLLSLAWRD